MKMANMDAMFDFMFTNPVDDHGVSAQDISTYFFNFLDFIM